jgi:hypothetical protein
MDWFKKHFDRVILAALGVAAIVCAGILISKATGFNEIFASRNSLKKPDNTVPTPGTALVKERIGNIESPKDWGGHEGSLFISEPYLIRGDGDPIPVFREGANQLFPPIPNTWIKQYGLDFSDPNLLNADPDGDRFSNLEEFMGKTDPTNAKSLPPYYTKLRLLEFIQVPFRLRFSGSPDVGVYSINTMDLKGPTQFLKVGEMIAGTPYKIVKAEQKTENKNDMEVDVSEVTIENQETGQKIVLVNDKPVNDPTVFARIKYLWDGSEFKVKRLDSFSVKPEETVKYKLIDISDTEAVIEDPQGKKITIPKADNP